MKGEKLTPELSFALVLKTRRDVQSVRRRRKEMRRTTEEIEKLLSQDESVIKECSERTLAKLLDYSPRNYESCLELADAYLILSECLPIMVPSTR